ncbi:MAG: hypothetical protein H6526_09440 [Actinobacteria bacterium]|nr:hypothetical protein [Actinomycetota bacterium]MCB8997736.1 hypothetical protein [Actinomycetota bacterium]MCB9415495.1 hypothetical protein [Actinomycetota bacterium]HRY10828.1 hypothetical protein [Candidatus Nanopelagicales bacterium]
MYTELAVVAALTLAPATVPGPINPEDGKIPGFTYGAEASNTYLIWYNWSGQVFQRFPYSTQHIGVARKPTVGTPFYLHLHTGVVAPKTYAEGVVLTLHQDTGQLPLRYSPSKAMPLRCFRTQFDPLQSSTAIACPKVRVENCKFVVSNLEPLLPGYALDIEVPVVVDRATKGEAAMTAMWASPSSVLDSANVVATVPVTVARTVTKPLPKKLRKYKKVKSLTPKVCKVKKRKVVVKKAGLCKLKGGKVVVKKRY